MGRLLSERCRFLIETLDLPAASGVSDAQWEPFQLALLSDNAPFRIEVKSRQIAWSFTVAAEAIASAILDNESTVFVSISQDEAKEKVRYAKRVYQNLDIGGLPNVVKDNELGLEFDNGTRILSLPSKPPRGKARMNVVLDEFAHVPRDKEIYTAAIPIITRGGRLRIGSSPLGASGMFWEIVTQSLAPYPGYERVYTPWWAVRGFTTGQTSVAEDMDTAQAINLTGNDRIKAIYGLMPHDDFEQEYCCMFNDETVAWITWDFIRRAQRDDLLHWKATTVDQAIGYLPDIKRAIARGEVEPVLVGGVDIGRKRHLTEVVLIGKATGNPIRLTVSLDNVRYDDQEYVLRQICNTLPVSALLIDQNGIGNELAERLGYDTCAEGVTFTNATKELWAVEARLQFERGNIFIPCDRDLAYQIHSIKRKVSAAKNLIFDTEANETHHADMFWATALALWASRNYEGQAQWDSGPSWQRR